MGRGSSTSPNLERLHLRGYAKKTRGLWLTIRQSKRALQGERRALKGGTHGPARGTVLHLSLFWVGGSRRFFFLLVRSCARKGAILTEIWAAANGGVTNGGLRGVWPPFPEIGWNRPFPPFFCLFRPFPEGAKSTWKIQKTEENGLFPQISSDLLKPPSLKPPFAALQEIVAILIFRESDLPLHL